VCNYNKHKAIHAKNQTDFTLLTNVSILIFSLVEKTIPSFTTQIASYRTAANQTTDRRKEEEEQPGEENKIIY
jgi:hypothetical protein